MPLVPKCLIPKCPKSVGKPLYYPMPLLVTNHVGFKYGRAELPVFGRYRLRCYVLWVQLFPARAASEGREGRGVGDCVWKDRKWKRLESFRIPYFHSKMKTLAMHDEIWSLLSNILTWTHMTTFWAFRTKNNIYLSIRICCLFLIVDYQYSI